MINSGFKIVAFFAISFWGMMSCLFSQEIIFINDSMKLVVSSKTGEIVSIMTSAGIPISTAGRSYADIFVKDQGWYVEKTPMTMKSSNINIIKDTIQELRLNLSSPEWDLTLTYRMPLNGGWFSRRAEWTRTATTEVQVEMGRFLLDNLCIDSPEECIYMTPSLYPCKNISLTDLKNRTVTINSWTSVLPSVLLYNQKKKLGVCINIFTLENDHRIFVDEHNKTITCQTTIQALASLKKGESIIFGDEIVTVVNGTLTDTTAASGKSYEQYGFKVNIPAAWTQGAALYSSYAGGTDSTWMRDVGNLKNFTKYVIPRLDSLGIGAVWFNPLNPGSYGISDYLSIAPELGNLNDLKETVSEAKSRNMHVMLDMIPHGPTKESQLGQWIIKNHPDWVSRDKGGNMKSWWGGLCMDYASPGWQDYINNVAKFYASNCDIYSWRVDVAISSPDNERPQAGLQPYHSRVYGALSLLRRLRATVKEINPDAIILAECGAITHLSAADFIYDMYFGLQVVPVLHKMPISEWVAETGKYLELEQASLPSGGVFGLMRFIENHDYCRSNWRFGTGHERSLLSLISLIPGLSYIYSDQDIGFGPHLTRLNQIRKLPEFKQGIACYSETISSAPEVFTFVRQYENQFSVVAINFAGTTQTVHINLPAQSLKLLVENSRLNGSEIFAGTTYVQDRKGISLNVPPYETRVIRFSEEKVISKQETISTSTEPAESTLAVKQIGTRVIVNNGFYKAEITNGFITLLTTTTGNHLINKVELSQGPDLKSGKKFLDFKTAKENTSCAVTRNKENTCIIFNGIWENQQWTAEYSIDDSANISIKFILNNQYKNGSFSRLELAMGNASEWFINTWEGWMRDVYSPTHPAGDMIPGRYARLGGYIWEKSQNPLHPDKQQIAVRQKTDWFSIRFPHDDSIANAILRERSSSGINGLNLNIELSERDHCASAEFIIEVGKSPCDNLPMVTGQGWSVNTISATHCFKNPEYKLDIRRSLGGGICGLYGKNQNTSMIKETKFYTNSGILPSQIDYKSSKKLFVTGSSEEDPEPDFRILRNRENLIFDFNGFLRLPDGFWKQPTRPLIGYKLNYVLNSSNIITLNAGLELATPCNPRDTFAAYSIEFAEVERISIKNGKDDIIQHFDSLAAGKRFWESKTAGSFPTRINLEFKNGQKLSLSKIKIADNSIQNLFLEKNNGAGLLLVFAFFDHENQPYNNAPLHFSCEIEVNQ